MKNNTLPKGTIIKGEKYNYEIESVLGQGSFGITYLANVKIGGQLGSLNQSVKVALKEFFMKDINGRAGKTVTCPGDDSLFDGYRRNFKHEALHLSELHHESIVKVLEYFEENGTSYFSMDYINGQSLEQYISDNEGLPEIESLETIYKIAEGVQCMHENMMLHLDIKPSNVMRLGNGVIKIIDFGLSKHFNANGEAESSTTIGCGTIGYAPIEQSSYKSGEGFPMTIDIYALGATLYKCLTNQTPPSSSSILNDGLPIEILQKKGVSPSVIALIESAMEPMRRKRVQTVSSFLQQIEEVLPYKVQPREIRERLREYYKNKDIDALKELALDGNRIAQAILGRIYMLGNGVARDYDLALEYLQLAAKQDAPMALTDLGVCYFTGRGLDKDESKAVELFRKAVGYGNIVAQFYLGQAYGLGKGVEKNHEQAFNWYLKAARQGHPIAQNMIGRYYERGVGVVKDIEKAVSWYKKSAEQGNAFAQCDLGRCYYNGNGIQQDYNEAVRWYRKAAEQGNASAQCDLGRCYYNGNGIQQDYNEAVRWYRKAAEQGHAIGQCNLGTCYFNGHGVNQDYSEAVKWSRKSAEQGCASAQCDLGCCYYNGHGIQQDYNEAVRWYRKAAEQGHAIGQCNLGTCYFNGHGVNQDYSEAVKWSRKSAEQGCATAQYNLGQCYRQGHGVQQDESEAAKWYRKAAEQGHAGAQRNLRHIYAIGKGESKGF